MKLKRLFILLNIIFGLSCMSAGKKENTTVSSSQNTDEISIADIMDTTFADGFCYPIGNIDGQGSYTSKTTGKTYSSWVISTKFTEQYSLGIHPGIDWNGSGGGNTDLGQPVYSIAKGKVIEAKNFGAPWGKVVLIEHKYLDNGQITYCYSLYAHLDAFLVNKGNYVEKRAQIGTIGTGEGQYSAHLHFELRKSAIKDYEVTYWPSSNSKDIAWVKENYEDPDIFIRQHRDLLCPAKESEIIIAIKNRYTLYFYKNGILNKKYEIALSQNPKGHKKMEGDLKLPEGEYFITGKEKGPFYGAFSEYLGNALLRISYPNINDANTGFDNGLITQKEKEEIIAANLKKLTPRKNTKLGGGIVIHGWKGDWNPKGARDLTWGCISMHNKDLLAFYEIIKLKTKIVIFP